MNPGCFSFTPVQCVNRNHIQNSLNYLHQMQATKCNIRLLNMVKTSNHLHLLLLNSVRLSHGHVVYSLGNFVTSCHFWLDWKKILGKTLRKCRDFNASFNSKLLDLWLPLSLRTFCVKVGTPGHFKRSVIHEATSTIDTMYIEPKWYNLKTTNYSM